MQFAGGSKFRYFHLPNCNRDVTGVGLRTSARTIRFVRRYRGSAGIEDRTLGREHYYGKLDHTTVGRVVELLRKNC